MPAPQIAHGSLHLHGAQILPTDVEEADWLLLDGGPVDDPQASDPLVGVDQAFARLAPILYLTPPLHVAASLGPHCPERIVAAVASRLTNGGNPDLPLAIVRGGNVVDQLEEFLRAGEELRHAESGARFTDLHKKTDGAFLRLPAEIARAAMDRARVVLLGLTDVASLEAAAKGDFAKDDSTTELVLRYEDFYRGVVGLVGRGDAAVGQIADLQRTWRGRLDESSQAAETAEITPLLTAGDDDQVVGLATCRHETLNGCRDAIGALLQLIATRDDTALALHPAIRPDWQLEWGTWPTNVRSVLPEWSIEVRSAKDWVE